MSATEQRSPHDQRHERTLLGACQAEVSSARAQLYDARHGNARLDVDPFRRRLVAALEEYAATIERSGAPLPAQVRVELDLYRGLGHLR